MIPPRPRTPPPAASPPRDPSVPQIIRAAVTEQTYSGITPETYQFPVRAPNGSDRAPILVLCEPPTVDAMRFGLPMTKEHHVWFAQHASKAGFVEQDMIFLSPCPPIPKLSDASASKRWKFVEQYAERANALIDYYNPRVVVTCGEISSRILLRRAVKITKARGVLVRAPNGRPVFPVLSPRLCTRMPDYLPVFDADLGTLHRLKQGGYDPAALEVGNVDYRWCTDLQELLDNPPKTIAVDTEGTGLNFRDPDYRVITVQITPRPGLSYVVPVDPVYWPEWNDDPEGLQRLLGQLRAILENPEIKKVGHNLKYDHGCIRTLGIEVIGWSHDTELMTRSVNENMMSYSLDDCVRIYVPEMSGYNDQLNIEIDKSNMRGVPRDKFLRYAGGDTDATFRLCRAAYGMLRQEPGQHFLYQRVQMRGLLSFAKRIETFGQCIDPDALTEYDAEVAEWVDNETRELMRLVPAKVRRKFMHDPKGMSFTRDVFVREVLFSKDGFGLKPKVYTNSTKDLPEDQRVPSTSTKDHFPYFADPTGKPGSAGLFVHRLISLQKANKLLSTYIRGFTKHIQPAGDGTDQQKIFPSYNFRTNTFRTNSQDPNGQNFPKRGDFAKGFLRLIKASAGKILVAADLSQIELRLTAWSANEQEMLRIYNSGGDIHEATASTVMRLLIEEFRALDDPVKALQRFRAKAVNFGFIYGAQWKTFQTYAKTQYGVDYSDREAAETRELFFEKYKLEPWHRDVEAFVRRHGYVPTLHGGVRHLPSIWSDDWKISTGAVRQAINAPIQRFGSDLGVIAIARLAAQADPRIIRPIGFVHDQVVCEADPAYFQQAMGWLVWVMENPPLEEWFGIRAPLPIVAEPDFGPNLASMVELKKGDDGIFHAKDSDKTPLPNYRVEKPEWWNDDEEQAYDSLITDTSYVEHVRETLQLRV